MTASDDSGRPDLAAALDDERLGSLFNMLSDGVASFDAEDRLVTCNDAFRRLLDLGGQSATAPSYNDILRFGLDRGLFSGAVDQETEWLMRRLQAHAVGGSPMIEPLSDGRALQFHEFPQPNGCVVTLVCEVAAVADAQALSAHTRLAAAIEGITDPFAIFGPDDRLIVCNGPFREREGAVPDVAIRPGMSFESFLRSGLDAGMFIEAKGGEEDWFERRMAQHRDPGGPFEQAWPAGRWVLVNEQRLPDGGTLIVATDITERKKAEAERAQLRAMVEESPEAIAIFDIAGSLLFTNPAHDRLFFTERNANQKGNLCDLLTPGAQRCFIGEIAPAIARGESWEGVLDAAPDPDHAFPLWLKAGAVRDDSGRPVFGFAFMHDHAEQAEAERALLAAKAAAEDANQMKTRLIAAISHDLLQPLHGAELFLHGLTGMLESDQQREIAERIREAVAAVQSILSTQLGLSQIELGVLSPNIAKFPIQPLLSRMASEFVGRAANKGIRLSVIDCDATVRSDQIMLERMLRNLLSNALYFTERGGILLGCRRRGESLHIEVWDSGPGIAEDQLETIFDEFSQTSTQISPEGSGAGLGLAIVDRLAELLGHEIAVESRPGHGSRFTIILRHGELES
ncbi:MAG: PAS domain-containing protein [Alphaproteobacteria bacterium]|nr:PAS domain-containing protein [Alphaproteobacteria bacterium]